VDRKRHTEIVDLRRLRTKLEDHLHVLEMIEDPQHVRERIEARDLEDISALLLVIGEADRLEEEELTRAASEALAKASSVPETIGLSPRRRATRQKINPGLLGNRKRSAPYVVGSALRKGRSSFLPP
jgi:hypothetical protein